MMRIAAIALCVFGLFVFAAPVPAQQYPNRTVTIIVPYPAGGPTDETARVVANFLSKKFRQNFIVENVTGGSTIVATNKTPNAPYRGAGRPEAAFVMERLIDLEPKNATEQPVTRAQSVRTLKASLRRGASPPMWPGATRCRSSRRASWIRCSRTPTGRPMCSMCACRMPTPPATVPGA
jgi:hypothetical protein